jgi:lipid A 3-O-deacylase
VAGQPLARGCHRQRQAFLDVMGLGYTLGGPDGKQEIGLRWSHTSNAGLKKPNPGQDFLQLRLVQRF